MFLCFLFFISLYIYRPPYAREVNKSVLNSSSDADIPLIIFINTSLPSSELFEHISIQIFMINNS